jgi:23S rRNA (cytosine1962-C5)-methyltransferase
LAAATRSSSIFKPRPIADSDAFRLVHGAADGAPGVFVDRYADTLVVHVDSAEALRHWQPVLQRELGGYSAAAATVHPRQASRQAPAEVVLWGDPPLELVVVERGVRYVVRPNAGLSVGLFLDMREVRSWLRSIASGRTVLNLFAYTCSLGVCAALGDAARVVNLDLSRRHLQWGQQNYACNGVPVLSEDFVYGEAFDWLARFAKRQQTFDLVIVDPPSFSSSRRGAFAVERDYPRLVAQSARCVAHGGMLLLATNHAGITDARFDAWLRSGLDEAERNGTFEQRWHEPLPDFPLLPGQNPYLKVRALVLD